MKFSVFHRTRRHWKQHSNIALNLRNFGRNAANLIKDKLHHVKIANCDPPGAQTQRVSSQRSLLICSGQTVINHRRWFRIPRFVSSAARKHIGQRPTESHLYTIAEYNKCGHTQDATSLRKLVNSSVGWLKAHEYTRTHAALDYSR